MTEALIMEEHLLKPSQKSVKLSAQPQQKRYDGVYVMVSNTLKDQQDVQEPPSDPRGCPC